MDPYQYQYQQQYYAAPGYAPPPGQYLPPGAIPAPGGGYYAPGPPPPGYAVYTPPGSPMPVAVPAPSGPPAPSYEVYVPPGQAAPPHQARSGPVPTLAVPAPQSGHPQSTSPRGSGPVPVIQVSPRGPNAASAGAHPQGVAVPNKLAPGAPAPQPSSPHGSPKGSPRAAHAQEITDKGKPTPTVPMELRVLTHPERITTSPEEVLRIDGINIHAVEKGQLTLIHENTSLTFHRTNLENVIMFHAGNLSVLSNVSEKPTLRPYRRYYVFSVSDHFFAIETPKELPEEETTKLEAMFYYYSRYVRMQGIRPGEETKVDGSTAGKGAGAVASVIEGGSKGLAKLFVVAGTGVAKGAQKTSDFYCKHRKAYDGPQGLTEEQREKLESHDTVSGKLEGSTETVVKATGGVVLGVKKGFRFIGDKVSDTANTATKPVKNTEWYKKKEEKNKKKKEEKEAKGVKSEPGVFSGVVDVAKTGWGALNIVKDGIEKGAIAAGTGVRDASVQATRHTDGDYAAELSKQRWNAVGNVGQSFSNAFSLLKETSTWWVKCAIYTGTGIVSYDADLPNKMSGPGWWEGWISLRGEIEAGLGWTPVWAVVRTHLIALYKSPEVAETDADKTVIRPIKFSGVRKVTVGHDADIMAGRRSALVIEKAKTFCFLSTCLEPHPGTDAKVTPKEEEDLHNWVNLIETFVEFQMPERVRKEKKFLEEQKEKKEKKKKEQEEKEKKEKKKK